MNTIATIVAFVSAVLLQASAAWAALPPQAGTLDSSKQPAAWQAWPIAAILVAGVVLTSIKSSKRSHLD